MKIGLVRHFKVNHPFPDKIFLSKSEVIKWFAEYDKTENLQYKNVDLNNIDWIRCYSSTMIRAVSTANHIYHGEIVKITELKELDVIHRLTDRIKLPFMLWGLIIRMKSFSSNNDTDKFRNEIIAFVDKITSNDKIDTLIVSHWFVMRVIRQELIKRGFVGDNIKSNEYGTLYVFEETDSKTTNR